MRLSEAERELLGSGLALWVKRECSIRESAKRPTGSFGGIVTGLNELLFWRPDWLPKVSA